jgi:4-hydroxythreonine-4-phosphate dehydrogenase
MPKNISRIGITMGDPSGIGPEVIAKAAFKLKANRKIEIIVLGDSRILAREIKKNSLRMGINELDNFSNQPKRGFLNVLNLSKLDPKEVHYGHPDEHAAKATLTYIDHAIRLAREHLIDAIVTAPVNKNVIFKIYHGFKGHTEYIAEKTITANPVMMMVSPQMKVIPVTHHTPLSKVSSELSINLILNAIRTANESLKRYFGITKPKIAVSGLNPHSGEEIFGTEESDIIYPAIKIAISMGINASGPLPGDSIFLKLLDSRFDVAVAMYHDQALIPIKTCSFHKVVNVTLGIPLIRTSVGHGVAYDIAGKCSASEESMIMAVKLATMMSQKARLFR